MVGRATIPAMRLLPCAVVAALSCGCGRIGFEPVSGDGPGDPDARLASITLWARPGDPLAPPMAPAFAPEIASYAAEVGLARSTVQVSAIPLDPATTITIESVPVAAGELSGPVALALGATTITVVGTTPDGAGASYTVEVTRAAALAQAAYVKASNTDSGDIFGYRVAVSGDTLVVGASSEDSSSTGVGGVQADNAAAESGAVYVFTRSAGMWSQQAYLKASNTEAGDNFGAAVAISGDTLVVGAPVEDSAVTGVGGAQADNGAIDSGAVYVFTRSAGVWSQQAYVKASNTEAGDNFGAAVAISGETLAVGAYAEDSAATGVGGAQADNSAADSGAVYVFARTAGLWSQQAYVKASNAEAGDLFGISVAVSGDTLAVGAHLEDSGATGVGGAQADNAAVDSGAVYMFTRSAGVWSQQAYLKASNTESGDLFGGSVAVSGDTLVVAAAGEDSGAIGVGGAQADNAAAESGAVYVFTRSAGVWSQQAYVKASNTDASDSFGVSVAVWGDTLVVGAHLEDSGASGVDGVQTDNAAPSSGAVYVFARSAGAWSQQAYLKASNTEASDLFGISVAVSGDTLAVGAFGEDSAATGVGGAQADNAAPSSGAVYVFR